MSRTFRVGVVGAGFGAAVHVPAWRLQPNCEVVAICAEGLAKAQTAAARLEIPAFYNDFRRMIAAEALDVVSFAVPPRVQEVLALEALAAGVAIFCEKPLATDVAAARRIVELAAAKQISGVVDFEFSQVPAWQRLRQMLANHEIGNVHALQVRWRLATYANKLGSSSWKTTRADGGAALLNFGSHCLHYLEWLAGPIVKLGARLTAAPGDERAGETRVDLLVTFASGAHGSVLIDTAAFCHQEHSIEVLGANGSMRLINESADYMRGFSLWHSPRDVPKWSEVSIALEGGTWEHGAMDGRILAVSSLMAQLVAATVETFPEPDLRAGLRVQQLINLALESEVADGQMKACHNEH